MKLKNNVHLISLFTSIPFFIHCGIQVDKGERKEPPQAFVDKGDSIYKGAASFIAYEFDFPIEKTAKYKKDDTSKIIKNKVAHHRHGYEQKFAELMAGNGVKYSFSLPNKTNISLNSGSNLVFHPSIGNYFELRKGEGYFEIEEDSTKLIVNNKITVTADKGTSLNITAYTGYSKQQMVSVSLRKGNVYLTNGRYHTTLNRAGTRAIFDLTNKTLTKGKCDIKDVLSWTRNDFSYNDIDYYTLLQRICRWYDLELEYPDDLPPDYWVFGGEFKEPVQQIIDRLNFSAKDIQCRIEGKKLIVSKK